MPPKTTSIPKGQIDPNPNSIQNSAKIIPTPPNFKSSNKLNWKLGSLLKKMMNSFGSKN